MPGCPERFKNTTGCHTSALGELFISRAGKKCKREFERGGSSLVWCVDHDRGLAQGSWVCSVPGGNNVPCVPFAPPGLVRFFPRGHPRLTAWAVFFRFFGAVARLTRHLNHDRSCGTLHSALESRSELRTLDSTLESRSELAFCGSHFETRRFAIVMSVTAFRGLSSRKSNWSVIGLAQPQSGARMQPTPQGVGDQRERADQPRRGERKCRIHRETSCCISSFRRKGDVH